MVHTKCSVPLSIEKWFEKFQPIPNKSNSGIGFEVDGRSTLHETSGVDFQEVQRVLSENPGRIWTLLDCDGSMFVSSGFHFVNRMGYFITEKPYTGNACLDIPVDDDDEDDSSEGRFD